MFENPLKIIFSLFVFWLFVSTIIDRKDFYKMDDVFKAYTFYAYTLIVPFSIICIIYQGSIFQSLDTIYLLILGLVFLFVLAFSILRFKNNSNNKWMYFITLSALIVISIIYAAFLKGGVISFSVEP